MTRYELGPMTYDKENGWHQKAHRMNDGDNLDRPARPTEAELWNAHQLAPAPVTREEYDGLLHLVQRAIDRIAALEARPVDPYLALKIPVGIR